MATPSFISALKSDRCVHYLNNTLVNRAQSIDINANVPSEVIDELGSSNHTGIVSAPAEVAFNVSVFDTGIDLCKNLIGKDLGSYSLSDFANAQVDYVGVIRDNAGNFFRSAYVKNACINTINYGYDVAGNAVESYSFLADNLTVFDGYLITKSYVVVSADVTNGFFTLPTTGSESPLQTNTYSYFDGAFLLRVTKSASGVTTNLTEGSDYTYTAATKCITATGLAVGQKWTIVFHSAQIGTALDPSFDPSLPPAVRGEFTPVSIGVGGLGTLIPRLQSAKMSINLAQKRVPQIGSRQVLYSPGGLPNVSGNFSVLMNDLSLRKLLTYGDAASSETQFGIEQMPWFAAQNPLSLEAVVKSPISNSVLKRIFVPEIVVTNGGMSTTVNGTLTETFTWTAKTGGLFIQNT